MNYFASGLENGLRIGADAYQRRKDREQQSALDKARRDLELERDLKRGQLERDLQGERITADAVKQFNSQTWTGGENEKDRKHRTGERLGSQAHQTTESAAERNLRKVLQKDAQKQNAQQFTDRLSFDYQNIGLGAGLKKQQMEVATDPNSLANQLQAEQLKRAKIDNAYNETSNAGGTPGTPKAPGAADQLPTLTPQQAQAAKPGTRYRTVDGRILTR